ncbi:MAG: cytochrome P450 [Pseudomonadota bacterium]
MLQTNFIPPAPAPRVIPKRSHPTPQAYLRYFQIMMRNPLEIWTENHYNDFILSGNLLGRHYAVVHDPEAIRHYLVTNASNYGIPDIRRALFEPLIGQGLLNAEGEYWKRTRKALTPIFTPRHVHGFAETMTQIASERAQNYASRTDETISMSKEMLHLTLDILMASLFSDETLLDTSEVSDVLDEVLEKAGMPHAFDLMSAPRWVPRIGRGEVYKLIATMRAKIALIVEERRKSLATRKDAPQDFLTLLLRAGEAEGAPLNDTEVIDNLLTFISAGHETTARSLTWTIYLLSKDEAVRAKAENEIDNAPLSATDPKDWSEILPYTTAVLKEAMRLYPAAAVFSRRALGPDRIGNVNIKEGSEIVTSPWVLHRHRKLWRDPDKFDPTRFLGEEAQSIPRFAYIPFGAGPRVCIGASFAMQEMVIILAKLMGAVRFQHAEPTEPQPVHRITVHPSTPVMMRIEKRH